MALWYLKDFINRVSSNPDEWIYKSNNKSLTGKDFIASAMALKPILEKIAFDSDYIVAETDKSYLLLPFIVACGLMGKTYVPVAPDTPKDRLDSIKESLHVNDIITLVYEEQQLIINKDDSFDQRRGFILFFWLGHHVDFPFQVFFALLQRKLIF